MSMKKYTILSLFYLQCLFRTLNAFKMTYQSKNSIRESVVHTLLTLHRNGGIGEKKEKVMF